MKKLSSLLLIPILMAFGFSTTSQAASVGTGGYTNNFNTQPPAADWSTAPLPGATADITTVAALDAAVQNQSAGSITSQVQADPADPPPILANATWSAGAFYLQTRPTGVGATLLLCTLVNNIGGNASAVTISYDFTKAAPAAEEVEGHRAYYSLSGAAGSWTVIPELSSAAGGRVSATINLTWPGGTPLYILWADENGTPSPDTANQIDNFSATATPATQVPVAITTQPQSQTVGELQPVSFTVALSGNPPPTVQWYTNGVAIPGATSLTYSIPSATLGLNGLNFRAVGQNVANGTTASATSSVATLTVNADTVRPALLGAVASGSIQVVATFSERVSAQSATNVANYSLAGPGGNLTISGALLDASQTNVVLTVSPMSSGTTYTLTVNGVRDQSAAGNQVLANSQAQFTAASYTGNEVGSPAGAGSAVAAGNGFNVVGGGTNIAGTADQFFFNWRQIAGDFDLKVRVDGLTGGNPWAKAGLMARETLTADSKHAATFATPNLNGTFFTFRATNAGTTVNVGSFPNAYPSTWLRLKRSGTVFTGYAGVDGQNWVQLGTATLSTPANLFHVGMAVTGTAPSNAPTVTASAQFRDISDGTGGTVGIVTLPFEPPGPSARGTGLIISEIMYHPKGSNALEFVEISNAGLIDENVGGYRISGDVDYTFPSNTIVPVGGYVVVGRNPAALQSAYGISGVLGPWAATNALPDDEGTVRLRNRTGALLLEVNYSSQNPWPLAADGTGHSLVLARPSYGEADPRAWSASDRIGGSPGVVDPFGADPLRSVVINEFLAHTDLPLEDFIELYNHSSQPVDISGAYLSDDRDTNKFRIPNNTVLPPRGFVSFNESTLGFALSSGGERIYFVNPAQTRVIDMVIFEAQINGVSSGRYPDGAPGIHELASRTPGATNAALLIREVVINELMFNPISGNDNDEYVELYNRGTNAVDLSGWRFTAGIDYQFPANSRIAAGGYLVVAKDRARLLTKYSQLNATNTFGDYDGVLANGGERIALARPDYFLVTNNTVISTQANYVIVDETTYEDSGRWAKWADGGGSSLELVDPNTDHRLAANWADSDETAKSQWTNVTVTALADHVYPINNAAGAAMDEVQVMILGGGEALMDDVDVHVGNGPNLVRNPDFSAGLTQWLIQGNHVRSVLEPTGPNNPSPSMRIRASAGGDNGANRVESDLNAVVSANTVATIGGKFRWLRGFPIVLMRLHGGGLEAVCSMPIPPDLGTPGLPNSRRVLSAGPAIYDVSHAPVMPAANEAVTVTARVSDPNGIASVQFQYRIDPATTANTLAMRDDGTAGDAVAGDGLYTVILPGQASGALVAFRVVATDSAATAASTSFPDASLGEALIRFGEPAIFGSLGVYRIWMTATNISLWTNRERLSNEALDGTFVYGNFRAIYNAGARYRGSAFTRNPSSPAGVGVAANYVWSLPDGDPLLGTDELNLDCLEPGGSSNVRDVTALREITSFNMLNQLDLSFSYQRYVHIVINGITSTSRNIPIYTDSQQPNGEYTAMWFPDGGDDGDLFKIDDWFEFADTLTGSAGTGMQGNKSASLENFTTTGGSKKQARYRWSWEKKFNRGLDDDYTSLFAAVDALNSTSSNYVEQVEQVMDIRQWLTMLAFRHVVGDWDGYGYQRGKNQFCYHPNRGKWEMLMWDLDFSLGCTSGHAPAQDLFTVSLGGAAGSDNMPEVSRLYNHPHFRRIYLQALQQIADGPLLDANFLPTLDARYRALLANGVTTITSPYANSGAQTIPVPTWIQQRRAHILNNANGIQPFTNATFRVFTAANVTTTSNSVLISGSAPFAVKDILINGNAWPVTWTSVTGFVARVPVNPGDNVLQVAGRGFNGTNVITTTQTVTAAFAGTVVSPVGVIVFNEIMHTAGSSGTEYVELFNTSSNATFDLSGWRIEGLNYTFPNGTFMGPRQFIVLTRDRVAYLATYGSAVFPFDQFDGTLQGNGERLTLIKPGATPAQDVIVDRVRYETVAPWPTLATGTGSAIQLIDSAQDNSRPLNWFATFTASVFYPAVTNVGWQFRSISANGGAAATRMALYLDTAGEIYVDDISVVEGTNAAVGVNLVRNGDFESPLYEDPPLTNTWLVPTNYTNTAISPQLVHSGNGSLHILASLGGAQLSRIMLQNLSPAPTNAALYTLSFWFYATNTASNVVVRVLNTSMNITTLVRPTVDPASNTAPIVARSPGLPNQQTLNLPAIPPLWINEVQADNVSGIADNNGQRDPWIELYNAGTAAVSLDGLYLSGNFTNLTNWAFPAGRTIGAGQFMVIFCDGQAAQTTAAQLHTSFRLASGSGSVALSRIQDGTPQVLDYVNYSGIRPDRSYGSFPDGQPFDRQEFAFVTPGGTNNGASAPLVVRINEWMAGNTSTVADPADGDFDDWFELYNPGSAAVNLAGYFLTDNLTNKFQYLITTNGPHTIPAGGYLLVWADEETGQNVSAGVPRADLHVSFRLAQSSEAIGLFAADGTQIDAITFVNQADDVGEGRFPDGTASIIAMPGAATPRAANRQPTAAGPRFNTPTLNGQNFILSWGTVTGQRYQVEYKNVLTATAWTPLGSEVLGNGATFSVTNSITNSPTRFYRIRQL